MIQPDISEILLGNAVENEYPLVIFRLGYGQGDIFVISLVRPEIVRGHAFPPERLTAVKGIIKREIFFAENDISVFISIIHIITDRSQLRRPAYEPT